MKIQSRSVAALVTLAMAWPAAADVIYSNLLDTTIPTDFTGVTISVGSGSVNPFFGGVGVANNSQLQPFRESTSNLGKLLNFSFGSTIDSSSLYLSTGTGGSQTHVGSTFTAGQEGYIGFKLNNANYGWMRVIFTNNTGGAVVKDWSYENSGAAIAVGGVQENVVDAGNNLVTLTSATGGPFTLGTQLNNASGKTNSVLKLGAGTVTLTGTNTYSGGSTINAGTLQFAQTASLYNGSTGSWTAANINVKSGATLALNVDSGGTAGFTSTSLDTLVSNISVANSATAGLQAGAKLGFDTSTATGSTFTQGNAIADSTGTNGGAIGVTKLGAGTLILDKANTYTGTTTVSAGTLKVDNDGTTLGKITGSADPGSIVVNNTGTLLLAGAGVHDRILDTTGITLSGGTLLKGAGASEGTGNSTANGVDLSSTGLGTLTLSANSTLDFGAGGVGTLTFNSFAASTFTLNVLNYTTAASGYDLATSGLDGTDDRLIFHTDVNAANFLNKISFNGVGAAQINLGDGYYEIVPVPEPATIFGALALVGLVGYRERRRFLTRRVARLAPCGFRGLTVDDRFHPSAP